ncbi:GyrI-like domain-containing protein [Microbacteriaceae bacterium VKM Ac-2854]|nr:GyrI-like domain-containing protein [Microbacteriaceae bacterium VKM Ac-2854]
MTIEISATPERHLAVAHAHANSYDEISGVITPMYPALAEALQAAGAATRMPAIAYYEDVADGVEIHAAFSVDPGTADGAGFDVVVLPAEENVASLVHHGEMADIRSSWEALFDAIAREGWRPIGPTREVYLVSQPLPQSEWVTRLEIPVARTNDG